ncbi:hypothetical protein ABZU75_10390 [Streptosporangium sp. NPDC005286]|uniref:hypothetical protein n=1 Tax=Streptosporangium sp. NPDC005286 TaxID=3154463 RepID=UPI0033A79338
MLRPYRADLIRGRRALPPRRIIKITNLYAGRLIFKALAGGRNSSSGRHRAGAPVARVREPL